MPKSSSKKSKGRTDLVPLKLVDILREYSDFSKSESSEDFQAVLKIIQDNVVDPLDLYNTGFKLADAILEYLSSMKSFKKQSDQSRLDRIKVKIFTSLFPLPFQTLRVPESEFQQRFFSATKNCIKKQFEQNGVAPSDSLDLYLLRLKLLFLGFESVITETIPYSEEVDAKLPELLEQLHFFITTFASSVVKASAMTAHTLFESVKDYTIVDICTNMFKVNQTLIIKDSEKYWSTKKAFTANDYCVKALKLVNESTNEGEFYTMQLKNQLNEKMKSLRIMMEYFLSHLVAFTSDIKKDEVLLTWIPLLMSILPFAETLVDSMVNVSCLYETLQMSKEGAKKREKVEKKKSKKKSKKGEDDDDEGKKEKKKKSKKDDDDSEAEETTESIDTVGDTSSISSRVDDSESSRSKTPSHSHQKSKLNSIKKKSLSLMYPDARLARRNPRASDGQRITTSGASFSDTPDSETDSQSAESKNSSSSVGSGISPLLHRVQFRQGTLEDIIERAFTYLEIESFIPAVATTYETFATADEFIAEIEKRREDPANDRLALAVVLSTFARVNHRKLSPSQMEHITKFVLEANREMYDKMVQCIEEDNKADVVLSYRDFINPDKRLERLPGFLPLTIPEKSLLFVLNLPVETIAEQLTIADYELFKKVTSDELLHANWTNAQTNFKSPNVRSIIRRNTRLTRWLIWSVVCQPTKAAKVKRLTRFMKLAALLEKMNNFMSLASVSGALMNASVLKMKDVIKDVKTKVQEGFSAAIDVLQLESTSHTLYRKKLRLMLRVGQFILPYLGYHLTDIVFIEDGNKDTVKDEETGADVINYKKRDQEYHVIHEVLECQKVPPPYTKNEEIINALESLPAPGWSEEKFADCTFQLAVIAEVN